MLKPGHKIRDARTGRVGTLASWRRVRGGRVFALAIAGDGRWIIPAAAVLRYSRRKGEWHA